MSSDSWKNDGAYEYLTGEERREVWAWEFLRRFPTYRQAWKSFSEHEAMNKDFKAYDPPRLENESRNAWLVRCDEAGKAGRDLSYSAFCGLPFHLYKIMDPAVRFDAGVTFLPRDPIPALLNFPEQIEGYSRTVEGEDWEATVIDPDFCVLAFDLRASWSSQLERAKELFNEKRKAKSSPNYAKPHEDHGKMLWRRHLRVLDAYYVGAKNPEIGQYLKHNTISSEDASAGDDFIQSALTMAANYRKILLTFIPKQE